MNIRQAKKIEGQGGQIGGRHENRLRTRGWRRRIRRLARSFRACAEAGHGMSRAFGGLGRSALVAAEAVAINRCRMESSLPMLSDTQDPTDDAGGAVSCGSWFRAAAVFRGSWFRAAGPGPGGTPEKEKR